MCKLTLPFAIVVLAHLSSKLVVNINSPNTHNIRVSRHALEKLQSFHGFRFTNEAFICNIFPPPVAKSNQISRGVFGFYDMSNIHRCTRSTVAKSAPTAFLSTLVETQKKTKKNKRRGGALPPYEDRLKIPAHQQSSVKTATFSVRHLTMRNYQIASQCPDTDLLNFRVIP